MRIALAQINPVVGDIAGNALLITNAIADARAAGAALVCLPELAMTGYPPEDLLLKDHVLSDVAAALERIAAQVEGIVAVIGYPEHDGAVYIALGSFGCPLPLRKMCCLRPRRMF